MSAWLAQKPIWYFVLIAYTGLVAVRALRYQAKVDAALRPFAAAAATPHEQGRVAGVRLAGWVRAGSWVLALLLLLHAATWAVSLVAIRYALAARGAFRDYARGFAEGRKAAALAASPEYVQGRVQPTLPDYLAAGLFTAATNLLPMGAAVYYVVMRRT